MGREDIGRIDAKTGRISIFPTSAGNSCPRRGMIDSEGQIVEYLLPKQTNVRRVFVDDATTPVTFWVGSNHGASIVRLEPLE
jgi:hypothetical protein